jgi:hypothetical protein
MEAGDYTGIVLVLACYDGVAEALERAREVHQEERDAAQAAEAGAVADRKLVARNSRMAAQKAKKTLDEVKAEYEHKLKRLQETEAAEKKNTAKLASRNAEVKIMSFNLHAQSTRQSAELRAVKTELDNLLLEHETLQAEYQSVKDQLATSRE